MNKNDKGRKIITNNSVEILIQGLQKQKNISH